MIFCWGGTDFKLQTDDRYILQMYLVFNVFYFYSGVGQKDSGVGRAHLPPPFATPLTVICTPHDLKKTLQLPPLFTPTVCHQPVCTILFFTPSDYLDDQRNVCTRLNQSQVIEPSRLKLQLTFFVEKEVFIDRYHCCNRTVTHHLHLYLFLAVR
jgi:hypothetical protein